MPQVPINRIAIMTAMPQEFALLRKRYSASELQTIAGREFLRGSSGDIEVILVSSGIGKVAAASTVTILLNCFDVDAVVLTGIAGGIHSTVSVGDIVVATHLVQHDIDLKGVLGYQRFTIPSLGLSHIPVCDTLGEAAHSAASTTVTHSAYAEGLSEFVSTTPVVHRGIIASGDTFVSDQALGHDLQEALPDLLAVEMEGAAVAQVCAEHGVSYAVARVISDSADDAAPVDFERFIDRAAAVGTDIFVQELLKRIQDCGGREL